MATADASSSDGTMRYLDPSRWRVRDGQKDDCAGVREAQGFIVEEGGRAVDECGQKRDDERGPTRQRRSRQLEREMACDLGQEPEHHQRVPM